MSCMTERTLDRIDGNFVRRIRIVPCKLFDRHPHMRQLDIELHKLEHKLEHMLELDDNTAEYIGSHMEDCNCS